MPHSHAKLSELHTQLGQRYDRLAEALTLPDGLLQQTAPAVSAWSVANQLHHIASATGLMLVGISRIARQAPPATETGRINTMGRAVLLRGRFPRGKGKAPARTVPPDQVTREELTRAISRSRKAFDGLGGSLDQAAASDWKVEHPYFGMLNVPQWLKLAIVHADHHFLIIDDIQSA